MITLDMPRNLSEVSYFMNRERLASFVTVDARNRPHVVPVFFTYEEGRVYVQTDRNSVKVKNLRENDNVALAVYSGEEAVIIRGKAKIIHDKTEFVKRTQQHIDKYNLQLDEQGRDSYGIPLFDFNRRCVVEVIPDKILFW